MEEEAIQEVKDEPGMQLENLAKNFLITTKRYDFKEGHNYWIIVRDLSTDTHSIGYPKDVIKELKEDDFDKAVALHYSVVGELNR